jgi:hypothetical protein
MNKQIEEMAREMCHLSAEFETCQICDEKYHCDGEACYFQGIANEIINRGYRKTEDIAREIFAQVDGITDLFAVGDIGELEMYDMLGKLKKKYESEGADDEQV